MNRLRWLALLFAIGCNDDTRSASTDEVAALCDLYRVACARQAECGVYLYSRTTDADACEEQLACEEVAAGFAGADITVSITDADSCRDTLAASTCEGLVLWSNGFSSALVNEDPACTNVFQGHRTEGDSCTGNLQCADGLECAGETCPGRCTEPAVDCQLSGCDDASFCASDGKCTARAAANAACEITDGIDNSCRDGLFCDFSLETFTGTCKPALARGQSCNEASFFICANGDVCRDGSCAPPTPAGEPCSSADECGLGSFCAFDAGQTCKSWLALGEPCTNAAFECGQGAQCGETSHVCETFREPAPEPGTPRPFVGLGEDCLDANCEAGLSCRPVQGHWTCGPAPQLGESCAPVDPNDQVLVLISGNTGVGGCAEGNCDVVGTWTCVVPQPAGAACDLPGKLTAQCASLICGSDGKCADYFECP